MNTQMSKAGALFIATIMLGSLIAIPIASAATYERWNAGALNRYNDARTNYEKAVTQYKGMKGDFMTARSEFKGYRADETGNKLEPVKRFLTRTIDVSTAWLNVVLTAAQGEPGLSEADKTRITSSLQEDIDWLNEQRTVIDNAQTKEELVSAAEIVQSRWENTRVAVKGYVGEILLAKSQVAIDQYQTARDKVEAEIQKAKDAGKGTTAAEELLSKADDRIETAKEKYASAKEAYASIDGLNDADRKAQEANNLVRELNNNIREAYTFLRNAHSSLKG